VEALPRPKPSDEYEFTVPVTIQGPSWAAFSDES
jgi:hypothetical protein